MIEIKKNTSNKKFGIVFSILFIFFSIFLFLKNDSYYSLLFTILGIILAIITFKNPKLLNSLNNLWMNFGKMLNNITTPVLLFIFFITLFCSINLIFRLLNRDILNTKFFKKKSYWHSKKLKSFAKKQFNYQF